MSINNLHEIPSWFNIASVTETMDAREMLEAGQHPLADVLAKTSQLKQGQIFGLITPFTPMPLIEKVTASGCFAYVQSISSAEVHTYFYKL
jgi:uncharacterized protein (DUF2249 family)